MDYQESSSGFECGVAQRALLLQRITGRPMREWMEHALWIEKLERDMQTRVVTFSFIGQDGERRTVKGTLKPYEKTFGKPYLPNRNNRFLLYYDIDACGWRTFQISGYQLSTRLNCKL